MESDSSSLTAASHEVDAGSSLDDSLDVGDEESSTEGPVVSLLSPLKAPHPSDFARKRKVTNPPKGKCPCRGSTAAEPKGVTASQRVKEFAEEPLCVSQGRNFKRIMGITNRKNRGY